MASLSTAASSPSSSSSHWPSASARDAVDRQGGEPGAAADERRVVPTEPRLERRAGLRDRVLAGPGGAGLEGISVGREGRGGAYEHSFLVQAAWQCQETISPAAGEVQQARAGASRLATRCPADHTPHSHGSPAGAPRTTPTEAAQLAWFTCNGFQPFAQKAAGPERTNGRRARANGVPQGAQGFQAGDRRPGVGPEVP